MSVAKCLDCYVKLETVPCSYYPGGVAYRCPQCKLEYTKIMYENFVRQYKELYGEEFALGYLFDEETRNSDIIKLGVGDELETISEELKELLEDTGRKSKDGKKEEKEDDDIASYEQPIQEA